ncbi:MAG TPA: hypothetical protein VEK07_08525 [Polyangiaceae bacterium]|nr:hypothetical protein [Polyangiaceae bacterium]
MKLGGLGDFLTLLLFAIGAIALAVHQGLKLNPSMAATLPRFMKSRQSLLLAGATCGLAVIVLFARHAQQPVVQEPSATWQPAPPPPGSSATARTNAEPEGIGADPESIAADPEGFGTDPEDIGADPEGAGEPSESVGEEPEHATAEQEENRSEKPNRSRPTPTSARAAPATSAGAAAPKSAGGLARPRQPGAKPAASTSPSAEAARAR